MKRLFDEVSKECSKIVTQKYSTSFSLGILFLDKQMRGPIYSIYGFVRFADEIVDTFHNYDKNKLLRCFEQDTYAAIENRISMNPILNSFQEVVHTFKISQQWIRIFLESMKTDLSQKNFLNDEYKNYIHGSAEVVGLMCLHVFTEGDGILFEKLKPYAMRLGSAFQKVNFLRDIKSDNEMLGRVYFPGIDLNNFSMIHKNTIEKEIEEDFREALKGIRMLPESSRKGVYLAYHYYKVLFNKIKKIPPERILNERIRVANSRKLMVMVASNLKHSFNMI
jgi:phytoene/squalene synthetase